MSLRVKVELFYSLDINNTSTSNFCAVFNSAHRFMTLLRGRNTDSPLFLVMFSSGTVGCHGKDVFHNSEHMQLYE